MHDHLLRQRRILVVEDEYMLADDLRQELEDAGSIVIEPVARVASRWPARLGDLGLISVHR